MAGILCMSSQTVISFHFFSSHFTVLISVLFGFCSLLSFPFRYFFFSPIHLTFYLTPIPNEHYVCVETNLQRRYTKFIQLINIFLGFLFFARVHTVLLHCERVLIGYIRMCMGYAIQIIFDEKKKNKTAKENQIFQIYIIETSLIEKICNRILLFFLLNCYGAHTKSLFQS